MTTTVTVLGSDPTSGLHIQISRPVNEATEQTADVVDELTNELLALGVTRIAGGAPATNGRAPQRRVEKQYQWNAAGQPICPIHGQPMAPSNYGGWYCKRRIDDQTYCQEKTRQEGPIA